MSYAPAPGPVRNVTIELRQGADNVTAVLSWQPPDEPNGIITQYQVLYAGYNGTQVHIESGYRDFLIYWSAQFTLGVVTLVIATHCLDGDYSFVHVYPKKNFKCIRVIKSNLKGNVRSYKYCTYVLL